MEAKQRAGGYQNVQQMITMIGIHVECMEVEKSIEVPDDLKGKLTGFADERWNRDITDTSQLEI